MNAIDAVIDEVRWLSREHPLCAAIAVPIGLALGVYLQNLGMKW